MQVEERRAANTCTCKVKCSSKMALRLQAEGEEVMLLSPIIISLILERCPTVGVRNSNGGGGVFFHHSMLANSLPFMPLYPSQASVRLMVSAASSWSNTMYIAGCRPRTSKWSVHAAVLYLLWAQNIMWTVVALVQSPKAHRSWAISALMWCCESAQTVFCLSGKT